jgi:hypothetical protein
MRRIKIKKTGNSNYIIHALKREEEQLILTVP